MAPGKSGCSRRPSWRSCRWTPTPSPRYCHMMLLWRWVMLMFQVCLMDLVNRDKNSGMSAPPVWAQYQTIINQAEGRSVEMAKVERYIEQFLPQSNLYIYNFTIIQSDSSSTSKRRRASWWFIQGRQRCMETSFYRKELLHLSEMLVINSWYIIFPIILTFVIIMHFDSIQDL